MNNFISMKQMTEPEIYYLIKKTDWFANKTYTHNLNEKRFIANLFYEPSTRTKLSFEVAERRLGFETIDFNVNQSSIMKGESIYDTAKTIEAVGASALVIRHSEVDVVKNIAGKLSIPVINAGDGSGEHPTQALLDIYTMYKEFKTIKGLNVLIVGDVVHSRVAHSNSYVLKRLGANVFLSSKNEWQDDRLGLPYVDIDEGIKNADVVMLLRIQTERHKNKNNDNSSYLTNYGLTLEREKQMKKHAIIMHPAPVNRGIEIADEFVESKRSRIFKQMEYGVYARMAIIDELLNNYESNVDYIEDFS